MLQYTNLYDFHAVTLATTTLLASFYFLIKKRYFFLSVFLILSGITKEQIWIITSFFGIPLLFQKTKNIKFLGVSIIIFSLVFFSYLMLYAIPKTASGQHFALGYYSEFGNSPFQVILNVFLSPQKIISTILEPDRLKYLLQLSMPLGFFSILSPVYLVFAIPDLLINLLSNNHQLHQIYYQYSAAITPFIFVSSIFGVKQFSKWFPKISKIYIIAYLLIFTFYSAYSFGPLPGANNPNIDMFIKPQPNRKIIENFLSKIPEKYSVAATNNLGSHLSQRRKISTIPEGIDNADIVLFLLNDQFAQPSLKAQEGMVEKLRLDANYVQVLKIDDFAVFKKQKNLL